MAVLPLNTYPADYSAGVSNDYGAPDVQANAGELIIHTVQYSDSGGSTISAAPTWNGQTMISAGPRANGFMWTQTWYVFASATATADILCPGEGFYLAVACARTYSGAASVAALVQQVAPDPWGNPVLNSPALAAGDVVDETLNASGFDSGFGNVTGTTWTEANSQTRRETIATIAVSVGTLILSTKTGTGVQTCGYTASADEPNYVHSLLHIVAAVAGPTIDTITSPVTHGQTGLTLTTTELGTITSMTVDGVAVASVSATGGDGTWVAKSRVDGATLPGYGSKVVVVGDGTDTASSSVTVNPPSTQSFVELTSVNTSAGYLGAYRTLNIGDQIAFDTAAELGVTTNYIDVDGGIYTDYAGTQIIWHWVATTKVTTQITLINGVVADTTPDPFTFTDVTNATISTQYTSNTITVSGIDTATAISITGGTYSINGGTYVSSSGTVTNGQTVAVRITSSSSLGTAVNAVLTIGGVSDTYTVTTVAADTTPDAFSFTDVTGATPSQVYTSNTITVAGINAAASISVTGGTYNINGGSYTSSAGTVTNGQTVTTRITSSASSLTAVNSTVTIGGVSDTFTVTTQFVADSTPDAFTFTDVTNQATNSVINSAPITVAGINTSTAISVSGGLYSIDGGAYTASAGTVSNGQLVRVQVTTPWTHSTATSAIVTIGGVSDTFTATTTTTVDTAPTAFTLNDVTGVAQNSTNDSNTITVTGINAPAAITITGGTYSINGGAFTASAGTVSYNDYVVVRNIASASLSTTTNAVLTIGGVSDTYSVTTSATVVSSNKGQRLGIGIKIGL